MSQISPSHRYFCIHGHFYQPPREDPFSGIIPLEPGAAPYPNWNEKIYAECYRPNAELENFKFISFNIGPTLCAWLQETHPDTLNKIIFQDQENVHRFGIGNAIAQPYNHTILPLATYQDKITQIEWGVQDFAFRFGRKPTGMWLPETAVDIETLTVLADNGIEFTILAPWQAAVEDIDVSVPYIVELPGKKIITVFFYHQSLSAGLSFNPELTTNADQFILKEIIPQFNANNRISNKPGLVLLASDGELYGHHQPLRDLFLAHLINGASQSVGITLIYPGLWLKQQPADEIVIIRERTSWSCRHGVQRWMGTCDCTPGSGLWKEHLRKAFDNLTEFLDDIYFRYIQGLGLNPWKLRNDYIQVILRNLSIENFLSEYTGRVFPSSTNQKIRLLLEAQYERQRIYTSCGWFFDDFDRIEPKNNIAYAVSAIRLTQLATQIDLSDMLLRDLSNVISERSGLKGDQVFQQHMQEARTIPSKKPKQIKLTKARL